MVLFYLFLYLWFTCFQHYFALSVSPLYFLVSNLLYFSFLLLPHSVSFWFFLGLSVYYVYIYNINYIYIYIKTHYICCLYSGLFSLILRLTAMINYVLCSCVLCYILCCFLVFLCAMFFLFVHISLILLFGFA